MIDALFSKTSPAIGSFFFSSSSFLSFVEVYSWRAQTEWQGHYSTLNVGPSIIHQRPLNQGFFLVSANLDLQTLYISESQTLILESEQIQGETHAAWSKTTFKRLLIIIIIIIGIRTTSFFVLLVYILSYYYHIY